MTRSTGWCRSIPSASVQEDYCVPNRCLADISAERAERGCGGARRAARANSNNGRSDRHDARALRISRSSSSPATRKTTSRLHRERPGREVIVVDSFSVDRTVALAAERARAFSSGISYRRRIRRMGHGRAEKEWISFRRRRGVHARARERDRTRAPASTGRGILHPATSEFMGAGSTSAAGAANGCFAFSSGAREATRNAKSMRSCATTGRSRVSRGLEHRPYRISLITSTA